MDWLKKTTLFFKDRQLRGKFLFVLGALAIFRLAANIPMPGVDLERLRDFFSQSQFFGLLNIFVGGTLSNFSVVMLGLGPYITGLIIIQLLTMIFPQLEKLYKEEGEEGRNKVNQYARMLTVPLAIFQTYAMLTLFQKQGAIAAMSLQQTVLAIITVTAGSVFLMWIGELISEKGIGNGVSLLIFAGIISSTPTEVFSLIATWEPQRTPGYLLFFAASILIIFGVVFITEARRNIPVSYAKQIRGNKMYGGVSTYLPININPAGVIPIIFALSILLFPGMVASFVANSSNALLANTATAVADFLQNGWVHGILFFILVFLFTYFYTAVTFDPNSIATNLQKMGGFVPGIRPGEKTAQFLHKILYRVLFLGALFLGTIAVLPSIVQGVSGVTAFKFLIGGTSLLIVVSVVLETYRQIKAQMDMREYDTY